MEMRLAAIEAVDEPEADLSSLAGLLSSAVAARPSAQSSPAEKGKPNKRAKKPKGK